MSQGAYGMYRRQQKGKDSQDVSMKYSDITLVSTAASSLSPPAGKPAKHLMDLWEDMKKADK